MSWADKALQKHQVEKMTKKVLNDSRFRKQQEEQMEYAKENDDYFISMNEAIRDENGIDVLRNEIVEKGGKTHDDRR